MKRERDWPAPPPNAGVVVRGAPGYPWDVRVMAEGACGKDVSGTVVAMAAVLSELLGETLNPDSLALALISAEDMARGSGVEPGEWERVKEAVEAHWEQKRARNPLRGIF